MGSPCSLRLVEAVDSPLCGLDGTGRMAAVNAAFVTLLGCPREACAGQELATFLSPADAGLLRERLASDMAGPPLAVDLHGARGGGAGALLEFIPADGVTLVAARCLDNEARRQTESVDRTLREYHSLLVNAPVAIGFSLNRRTVRYNQRFADMFGYQGDEGIGRPTRELYPADADYDAASAKAFPLLSRGLPFEAEMRMRRQDDSTFWAHAIAYLVDPAVPSQGTIWIISDISEKKAIQDQLDAAGLELKRTLRELEAVMGNASVGVLITRNRCLQRYNANFAQMFGFAGDAGLGQPARMLYRSDEEYAALGAQAGPLLGKGTPFQTELWMQRLDGSALWVNVIAYVENPAAPTEGTIWILEDRTAFRRAEEALQKAHDEQQLILDHSVVGIAFVKDRVFQRCNRRLEEIYGYAPGEMDGASTRERFLSEAAYESLGQEAYPVLSRGGTYATEQIHRKRNGEPFWVRITGRAVDPTDPASGSIWNHEDITDRKLAEDSLRESQMLQRAILDSATLMIVAVDRNGRIVTCNPATEAALGWREDELQGRLPTELFIEPAALEEHRIALEAELGFDTGGGMEVLVARARLGLVDECVWRFLHRNGSVLPVQLSVSPLRREQQQVQGFLLVGADITERLQAELALQRSKEQLEVRVKERTAELESEMAERRRAEQRLRYLAHHDSLTGLPNRTLLRARLDEAIAGAAARGLMAAVLFIDLDRFKNVNDSLGHHAGDKLLKAVALRISSVLRAGDTVARVGGDEFVVVLPFIESQAHAEAAAAKLREALQAALSIAAHELFATPSIGLCFYPHDGANAETLLRHADTAMYAAKAAGRNTVRRFDAAMTAAAEQHFQIEGALRRAIQRREFVAHYQPWVALADGQLAGMEVLVRWQHPERGLLAPLRFIPIAEESGLIAPIGELVLRAACEQLRAWDDTGLDVPALAVNLSPWQFRDARLLDVLRAVTRESGIDPSRLELEITESAIMQDGEQTLATLRRMKDAGFRLSVDDFGTGYSSLAYLKRFPVDKLKIDRSFVIDMTTDTNDDAIVRTVVALARTLRLQVTAEGVETAAQRDLLRAMGCDYAQGFLYARPYPAEQVAQLAAGWHRAGACAPAAE